MLGPLGIGEFPCRDVERRPKKLPDHVVNGGNGIALDPHPAHSAVSTNDAEFLIEVSCMDGVFEFRQYTNAVGGMNEVFVRRWVSFDAFKRPPGECLIGAIDREHLFGRSV